jgi:hypothetical protein
MQKQKIRKMTGLAIATAIWIGASTSAFASLTLTVGPGGVADPPNYILGEVIPPLGSANGPNGLADRDEAMIDALRVMELSKRTLSGSNPEYYRSATPYASLPDATQTGMMSAGSIGAMHPSGLQYISIQLPIDKTYQYLVGVWDNNNSGAEVWYIGNVAAGTEILIPRYAHPIPASSGNGDNSGLNDWPQNLVQDDSQYQISTWTMFNPTVVPEPSTVIAGALLLLPFGASTLRILRKKA